MSSVNVIQLMQDEISLSNTTLTYMQGFQARKRAASKIKIAAKALGPDRARAELMPMLTEFLNANREEDEVLFEFSRNIDLKLFKLLGGGSAGALAMLPVLESLVSFEEPCVRETSVEVFKGIIPDLSSSDIADQVVPMIKRLGENEWFSPHQSGLSLIPSIFTRLSAADQDGMFEFIEKMSQDETPMVRATVAQTVGDLAATSAVELQGKAQAQEKLLNWYKVLTQDAQKFVRIEMISRTGSMAKLLSDSDVLLSVIPLMKQFAVERSVKVRMLISEETFVILEAKKASHESVIPIINDLLQDAEDSVKIATLNNLLRAYKAVGKSLFISSILPTLKALCDQVATGSTPPGATATTSELSVQARVALVNLSLILVDEDIDAGVLKESFKAFWDRCLVDTQSQGHADVRRTVIDGLPKLIKILGMDFITSGGGWGRLLRDLFEASKNFVRTNAAMGEPQPSEMEEVDTPKWRTRVAIVMNLDTLARVGLSASAPAPGLPAPPEGRSGIRLSMTSKKTSTTPSTTGSETGKDCAIDIWKRALTDDVNHVRIAAANVLTEFLSPSSGMGGAPIVEQVLVPYLKEYLIKSKPGVGSFQHRITFLRCCANLKDVPGAWTKLEDDFVELIRKDPVPNVRISGVRLAAASIPAIKSRLAEITSKEEDGDVKEAVKRAHS